MQKQLNPYYEHERLTVPAKLLPFKVFTAQTPIIPSGVKTYPATTAYGTLTITNGSIIGQLIPARFIVEGVVSDRAVYVPPPGSANGYSYATVSAHALVSGKGGNFATLAINQVIDSSVYIRNLSPFTGGRDNYSIRYVTSQNRQNALNHARQIVAMQVNGLHYSCKEFYLQNAFVGTITWRRQFLTYHIPSYMHVSNVQLIGTNFLLSVWFVEHPKRFWVK